MNEARRLAAQEREARRRPVPARRMSDTSPRQAHSLLPPPSTPPPIGVSGPMKQGALDLFDEARRTWSRRWFVLDQVNLKCFATAEMVGSTSASRRVVRIKNSGIKKRQHQSGRWVVEVHEIGKTLLLAAASRAERDEWATCLVAVAEGSHAHSAHSAHSSTHTSGGASGGAGAGGGGAAPPPFVLLGGSRGGAGKRGRRRRSRDSSLVSSSASSPKRMPPSPPRRSPPHPPNSQHVVVDREDDGHGSPAARGAAVGTGGGGARRAGWTGWVEGVSLDQDGGFEGDGHLRPAGPKLTITDSVGGGITSHSHSNALEALDGSGGSQNRRPRHRGHSYFDLMSAAGFTDGLAQNVRRCAQYQCPLRYWLIDNSRSMQIGDGQLFADTDAADLTLLPRGNEASSTRSAACSRWEELKACVDFHARVAEELQWMTHFTLINAPTPALAGVPQSTTLGVPGDMLALGRLRKMMDSKPSGKTPLCGQLRSTRAELAAQAGGLRANGHEALIVLATDGQPTDGSIVDVLETFADLPVHIIVRLCTDSVKVVEYVVEIWGGQRDKASEETERERHTHRDRETHRERERERERERDRTVDHDDHGTNRRRPYLLEYV